MNSIWTSFEFHRARSSSLDYVSLREVETAHKKLRPSKSSDKIDEFQRTAAFAFHDIKLAI